MKCNKFVYEALNFSVIHLSDIFHADAAALVFFTILFQENYIYIKIVCDSLSARIVLETYKY